MIHYFQGFCDIDYHVENCCIFATDDNFGIFFYIKSILFSENYQTIFVLNYSRFIASKVAVHKLRSNW